MTVTSPSYAVEDLQTCDVIPALRRAFSTLQLGGVHANAEEGYTSPDDGHGVALVRFTDTAGSTRVAEIEVRASWLDEVCWHLRTVSGPTGPECADCGTPPPARTSTCQDCGRALVDDVGVHTASCSVFDVPCAICGELLSNPGVGAADPEHPDVCERCAASEPGSPEGGDRA